MIRLLQAMLSHALFIGLTVGVLVLIAVGFHAVNFAYFAAVSQPDPNSGTGTASWNLFRWRNARATPRHQLPDWVINKTDPPPMTEAQKWEAVKALKDQ
ncbi:MAG: hypothetical protein JWN70_4051 [Planctomycetaceae bacterium]|nr:hypothetical protein [Planctomycetaceae bacterium]